MMKYRTFGITFVACWLMACQAPVSRLSDDELQVSANRGNAEAQYRWAKHLAERGHSSEAMQWMQKVVGETARATAPEQRAAAALQVGDWYQAGLGEPKNISQARRWWTTALRLGNGEAGHRLGMACQTEHQGKRVSECLEAFVESASKGYAPSQLIVAQWHVSLAGGEQAAADWLQKAAAQGNRDAQYQLALRYEQGKGVAIRRDLAERGYFRAAMLGQPQAQLWMARHAEGNEASNWYQKAASNGEVAAQLWLGNAYRQGGTLPQDTQKADYWLTQAASGGSGEASYLLSQQQMNPAQRESYLVQAASAGYARAQREWGEMLIQRDELPRARAVFADAAAAGDDASRLMYGDMLRLGQGGKANYVEAVKQYRLAAQQNNRMAQYRMGLMRQEGLGVPRNRIHAYAWYALAATEGMNEAIHARDELEASLAPEEINAAQRLALHWAAGKTE